MATPDQIPTELTLEIGANLTPEAFIAATRNFFGYVQAVTEQAEGEIQWAVSVREGSNLIAIAPVADVTPAVLATVYERSRLGAQALMGGDIDGSELNESALGYIRNLSQLTASKKLPIEIRLWVERAPVEIGPRIAEVIQEDWRTDYRDYGTVEGNLRAIQESRGNLKIKIHDALFSRPIDCYLPEKMIQEAFDTFRKRVEVAGIIHYRRNGTPISIDVEAIEVLPDDADLPTHDDVRGIFTAGP